MSRRFWRLSTFCNVVQVLLVMQDLSQVLMTLQTVTAVRDQCQEAELTNRCHTFGLCMSHSWGEVLQGSLVLLALIRPRAQDQSPKHDSNVAPAGYRHK